MKILNFGSINADHVYKVPHIVRPGETLSSSSLEFYAGGKGANQSVAMAKAGAQVWHAGKIGRDGGWLKRELERFGVHTEHLLEYSGPTGHAIIQVSAQGENSIVLFGGGNLAISSLEVDEVLSNFERGDYVVLQNEINKTPEIIEKAHEKGMIIYLNPAPFGSEIRNWPLQLVNTLILNETEAMDLLGTECTFQGAIDSLSSNYPETDIVMTVGKDGAYFAHGKCRYFVSGREVKVVDTTAAGDTFLGYYLMSRIEGADPEGAMTKANFAASITVSRPGAMGSIPVNGELG